MRIERVMQKFSSAEIMQHIEEIKYWKHTRLANAIRWARGQAFCFWVYKGGNTHGKTFVFFQENKLYWWTRPRMTALTLYSLPDCIRPVTEEMLAALYELIISPEINMGSLNTLAMNSYLMNPTPKKKNRLITSALQQAIQK
jgi:hypothetical protein